MSLFNRLYLYLVVYPYSLLFNLRYLSISEAIHIPILVNPTVKIGKLHRGNIILRQCKRAMVIIGLPGSEGRGSSKTLLSVHEGGQIVFYGNATFSKGTRIVIKKGKIEVGRNVYCNCDCFFHCTCSVVLGNDNLIGWDVQFNTTNGHDVYENGKKKNMEKDIILGNHVWVGAYSIIAKGAQIADDSIIAQSSLVVGRHVQNNSLIAGIPAKDIKYNYSWK